METLLSTLSPDPENHAVIFTITIYLISCVEISEKKISRLMDQLLGCYQPSQNSWGIYVPVGWMNVSVAKSFGRLFCRYHTLICVSTRWVEVFSVSRPGLFSVSAFPSFCLRLAVCMNVSCVWQACGEEESGKRMSRKELNMTTLSTAYH